MSASDRSTFRVECHTANGVAVYQCSGDLDGATAPVLDEALAGEGGRDIILDVASLSFCDSSGIAVLTRLARSLSRDGHTVTLREPSPMLRRVMEITRSEELFRFDTT